MVDRGPTLRGKLTLDTSPYSKSLRSARSQSQSTFAAIQRQSQALNSVFRTGAGLIGGLFAARTIRNLFSAGESLENVRLSLEGLLGSAEAADQAFRAIDGLAVEVKQDMNDLSKAFLALQTVGLGSIRNLELAADVATVFNRSTEDVATALRSLETETLRNTFGFDQVSTAAGNFSASLNGVVVASGRTRQEFRENILAFVETSRFAGAARNAADTFGSGLSTLTNTVASISESLRRLFGPALVEAANSIKGVADDLKAFADANAATFSEQAAARVASFTDKLFGLKRAAELSFGFLKEDIRENLIEPLATLQNVNQGNLLGGALEFLSFGIQESTKAARSFNQESQAMVNRLGKTERAAQNAAREVAKLGSETQKTAQATSATGKGFNVIESGAREATPALQSLNSELGETRESLAETTSLAHATAGAIEDIADASEEASAGPSRSRISLGQFVDEDDPASIRRGIANLESGLRQSALAGAGAANRIQQRAFRAELDRLQQALVEANRQQESQIVDAIISANRELTGEALTQRIHEELAIRRRQGLLPATGSIRPGFVAMPSARF